MSTQSSTAVLALALGVTTWAAACGGDGTAAPDPVAPPVNQAPVPAGAIPAQTAHVGEAAAVDVSSYFNDPDGDALSYAAASGNAVVATVAVSGSTVTATGVAQGTATITVTATDPGGLSAQQSFEVTVPNRAPEPVGSIPDTELIMAEDQSVDVAEYFNDPDGDALSYAASSADDGVATVAVSGSTVEVVAAAAGSVTITITASDPGGLEAQQQWAVTVKPNPDRAALEAFYEAAGGDDWGDNSNWLTDAPLEDWYGVDVNRDNRVVSLVLNTNNLKGRITPEIGNLTALETLSLRRNWRPGPRSIGLTGPIPREIGNLSRLTDLVLSSNELTGRIPPELGQLADLARLDMGWNDLTGPIPTELTGLLNLTELDLSQNNLTGTIPPGIGDMVSLTKLELSHNGLSGEIPVELGQLSLTRLHLDYNTLHGKIPVELGNISTLQLLYLRENRLTGDLPSELGNLSRLIILMMNDNQLEGSIPDSYLQLTLSYFHASNNKSVCMPDTTAFKDWLNAIGSHDGPFPPCP